MKRLGNNVDTVVFNDLYFSTKCDILFQIKTLNIFACKLFQFIGSTLRKLYIVSKTQIFVFEMC